jgi:membrane protein DedA with SNARE-associated domain
MYWTTRWAGRPFVLKYGKYFLVSPAKVEKAERWAAAYGNYGIFASRLLPVVRHLIGIPAGIVRLNYWRFSLWTLVGSTVWCAVLCWLGVKAGQNEALMKGELHAITLWAVAILAVLGVVYYFFVHRHMQTAKK